MAAKNVVDDPVPELVAGNLGVVVGEALGMLIFITVGPVGRG